MGEILLKPSSPKDFLDLHVPFRNPAILRVKGDHSAYEEK